MKAYVWDGEITDAYGGYGFLVVVAEDAEHAKLALAKIANADMGTEDLHAWKGEECKCVSWWDHLRKAVDPVRHKNNIRLEQLNKDVVVSSDSLEPSGRWDGSMRSVSWDKVLNMEPKEINLDKEMILAYYYGYEG